MFHGKLFVYQGNQSPSHLPVTVPRRSSASHGRAQIFEACVPCVSLSSICLISHQPGKKHRMDPADSPSPIWGFPWPWLYPKMDAVMENPNLTWSNIWMMIWGYPYFRKPPYRSLENPGEPTWTNQPTSEAEAGKLSKAGWFKSFMQSKHLIRTVLPFATGGRVIHVSVKAMTRLVLSFECSSLLW